MNHSKKIHLLDSATINKIAAGEVIENASSVVKELIENAIDAEACSIFIETKGGGRVLVRVSDDGIGMNEEDLLLCLERHATSKITQSEDLFTLKTLGFRGEAIPSIASVSHFSLHSSYRDPNGHRLSVEGGKLIDSHFLPRQRGTTVEVKHLFYNTPVRKKFQKSLSSDTADIHRVLMRTSLCYPALQFTWKHDDKIALETRLNESLKERLSYLQLCPLEEWIEIHSSQDEMSLEGFISSPHLFRTNKSAQYLFLNHRPISSSFLSDCLLEGYGSRLPSHRYPFCVLHLNLPPNQVDVNVHPQKKEVRFREQEALRNFIVSSIDTALQKRYQPIYTTSLSTPPVFKEPSSSYSPSFETASLPPTEESPVLFSSPQKLALPKLLGWVGGFALLSKEEHFYFFDPKAALSRVYFDHHIKTSSPTPIEIQSLLFPIVLTFSPDEAHRLSQYNDFFSSLGISIHSLSGGTFSIDGIPFGIEENQIFSLLSSFLHEEETPKHFDKKSSLLKVCKSFQRKPLAEERLNWLLEGLFKCSDTLECPLGKPIMMILKPKQIEEIFCNQ